MLRSAAARSGFAATRFIATDAPAGAPSTTPPPPPPTSSGSGFLRRALPLAFLGSTGYILYKGGTDPDFRAAVENHVPGSARFFDLFPSPSPPPNFVAQTNKKETSPQKDSDLKDGTALSSSSNSVPDILLKIEESNTQVANADGSPEAKNSNPQTSKMSEDLFNRATLEEMTPTQRAAIKAKASNILLHEAGDGPLHVTKATNPDKPKKPVKSVEPVPSERAKRLEVPHVELKKERAAPISEVEDGTMPSQEEPNTPKMGSAKGKLARILGKGDFQAEKVEGPDVVDDAEYKKPNFHAKVTTKTSSKKTKEEKCWPNAPQKKLDTVSTGNVTNSEAVEEVKALRAELNSQVTWEAVRLQEAVRSQMVEDKKSAAKEMAVLSQKHAEELVRVREDALDKANNLISERKRELKESADRQRDAEVGRLLKAKEEELRQSIALEFASKQQQQATQREQALADVKAQVAAMTSQFDFILMQSERAKEASKRASHAFLLREIIGSCRPLGTQLSKASDESELGRLVKESVPISAVQKGVSSFDALQTDFNRAAKKGLSVAMVPDEKAGTIWGHLLGAIFSRLKIPIDTRIDSDAVPKSNEDRIRLAQQLVKEGDLGGAVSTLESLEGLSAEVMADWIGAARARIAVDLAADVLLADAIIAQVTLTRGANTETVVA